MSDFRYRLRSYFKKTLAQKTYVQFAYLFNVIQAKLVLHRYKKPLSHIIDCGCPLVYISQPPRSGGTLLRNLFDGHRECFVFPHELSWEKNGYTWQSSISTNKKTYRLLFNKWIYHAINNGMDKKFPLHFSEKIFKQLFFKRKLTGRQLLDNYFTCFFNAWIDYQNLYASPKRYCVAFCPNFIHSVQNIEHFFNLYPDGFRIQTIRDPLSWWASEKKYGQDKKLNDFIYNWENAVINALEIQSMFPKRYLLLDFTNLLENPTDSMEKLCSRLDLEFQEILTIPTFNDFRRAANTSHSVAYNAVSKKALYSYKEILDQNEIAILSDSYMKLYNKAVHICVNS